MPHPYAPGESQGAGSLADLFFYSLDDAILEVQVFEPRRGETIPERLVQTLWQRRQFDARDLRTAQGDPIEILAPGRLNTDQGPDFLGARILIAGIDWRGDVEVHTTSRLWVEHGHDRDARYNSTILHGTLFADAWTGRLTRADGSPLPELVLEPHLTGPLRTLLAGAYDRPEARLPCHSLAGDTSPADRLALLTDQARRRLLERKKRLETAYLQTPDLETLLHRLLFAGLGYARNTEAMLDLAGRIPLGLALAVEDAMDLEALHFGVAGLLPDTLATLRLDDPAAAYVTDLRERFERLQAKRHLPVMSPHSWRFFRLRPANFPTLRIAQAVALLCAEKPFRRGAVVALEEALASAAPVAAMRNLLAARPGAFWRTHYRFDRPAKPRDPRIGEDRFIRLLINAVVPVLLVHADLAGRPFLEERLVGMLRRLPAETDQITALFRAAGFPAPNAYITQGAHQQYRTFCRHKRCLDCALGRQLIDAP